MTPHARTRARAYDPGKVRRALAAEVQAVRDAVAAMCSAADARQLLDAPTRLGAWTVRELIVHVALGLDELPSRLEILTRPSARPPRPGQEPIPPAPTDPELDLQGYLRSLRTQAEDIAGTAVAETAALPDAGHPRDVLARLDAAAGHLGSAVAQADGATVIPTRFGAMTVDDFLITRLLETVVHGDDLTAATGAAIAHDRHALATVTRMLADALAVKAPGGSVEVRIPPFAVVQCVAGPRHTRGTPSNVVETDPLTWIRLATGRKSWAAARDTAEVSASGERADLSDHLPVLG
ncbi:sterol carrier family protein [Streptomyces sp. KR80]|uniref:sterol carrier family protein n=1 Tax=Streptomyces sp. KR80 TaxID=3457426 RepID=UPI003FD442AC